MMEPSDDEPEFADSVVAIESAVVAAPLQRAPPTPLPAPSASSKYHVNTLVRTSDEGDSDSDEFHDSESDAGTYTVVKKSIFKEPKRSSGLLSRLKDASVLRSPARSKYVLTTTDSSVSAVAPVTIARRHMNLEATEPQITIATLTGDESDESTRELVSQALASQSTAAAEDAIDDGSDITVAIQATNAAEAPPEHDSSDAIAQGMHDGDEMDFGAPPQVVIHSGESDSDSTGFAMLNPVLGSSAARRYRSTVPLAAATAIAPSSGPYGSQSSASATAVAAPPCLQEIPALSSLEASAAARTSDHKLVLVVHALGASGLAKVDKFGTQSTFLEMRVCDSSERLDVAVSSSDAPLAALGSSIMRTALHKKGGSDAQWHQQFSTPLRSKDAQFLHIAVRTHNKAVVGDARVSLAAVPTGGLIYDQHYPIFRRSSAAGAPRAIESTSGASGDGATAAALSDDIESGLVHLQLKIVDAQSFAVAVPPLQLSLAALASSTDAQSAVSLPPVLRTGALLFKVPFHSRSIGSASIRRQWVAVTTSSISKSNNNTLEITWCDPTARTTDRTGVRSLDLELVTEVREGHRTKAFERQLQTASASSVVHERDKCFSLVTKARTLDLVASCKEEARVWVSALRSLLFQAHESDSALSARVMEDYRLSALSPRHGTSALPTPLDKLGDATSLFASSSSKAKLAVWRNAIFDLARKNRTQEISMCLRDGCPVDLLEPGDGDTVLMIACRLGHVQLVELCLAWRAKNDPHPEFGETALQAAVNASHAACVALLLSTAAKSDMDSEIVNHIDSNNDAPLHVAARHGDLACLQLLLHHGADMCVVEEFGRTPLHCAVAHGHFDCVAYLLDVGGDSVLNAGDHDGDTALHYAALAGNEAIVKLLLESAANVFSANAQNETPYDIALREKQQQCAFLISQYYLTNTKETPTASSHPASRNEAASTLLLRQQQQEALERDGDCSDDDNDEDEEAQDDDQASDDAASDRESSASESDASARFVQRSARHARSTDRPLISATYVREHERLSGFEDDCDGDGVYERYSAPVSARTQRHERHCEFAHRMESTPSVLRAPPLSRMGLSPSDQVREALLRNQSLRAPSERLHRGSGHLHAHPLHHTQHHYAAARSSRDDDAFYYSARDASRHHPALALSARGAFTERSDRYDPDYAAFSMQGAQYSRQDVSELHYAYARQPGMYQDTVPGRSRSHSDEMHYGYAAAHEDWRRWDDAPQERYPHPGARRSNSVDMTMSSHRPAFETAPAAPVHPVRTGWESARQSQVYEQPTVAATAPNESLWDTFYTREGYPYYVHRVTGASQWELPTSPPSVPPQPPTLAPAASALPPDSLIRMRLAETRKQLSSGHATALATSEADTRPPDQTSAVVTSLPQAQETTPASLQSIAQPIRSDPLPPPAQSAPAPAAKSSLASESSVRNVVSSEPCAPVAPSIDPLELAVSPPASPTPRASPTSKFQARMGFALSVDIASPTRKDGKELCVHSLAKARAHAVLRLQRRVLCLCRRRGRRVRQRRRSQRPRRQQQIRSTRRATTSTGASKRSVAVAPYLARA